MNTQTLTIPVSSDIGSISAECFIPERSNCILTMAHGAGAGMNHPFMVALAKSLSEKGIVTLRFNFPYMEQKKKRPDVPVVAHKTIEAAINKAIELFPSLPLFISGKSFGGRMSSQYLSIQSETNVKGVIFYGFPLHAPGNPSIDRAEHLKNVKVPMLFLQGTRDEFATWELIDSVCSKLPLATLVEIEGANHAFKAGKTDTITILKKETYNWINLRLNS
ncbi:alpha/beta family hydrolase [Solitalea lacus]|uniref:alpha/beta hydrolase family protein n=1 Tax=Solitalea lacus TaxID=2911172 RepID=UPI001EDB0997|nr:alpha/beta family hydrolase [Solitalea lacus]UKJ06224.1 dienelactone hydrolase family protein [Solitalea lacus]